MISILADSHCILCGREHRDPSGLCVPCQDELIVGSIKPGARCPRCSEPQMAEGECPFCGILTAVESFITLSWFHSRLKELLLFYKTGKELRLRFFFARMIHMVLVASGSSEGAVIVPVPPRRGKVHRQGWDQVDLLCRTLHSRYGWRYLRLLKRTDRLQQKTLGLDKRKKHMESVLKLRMRALRHLEGAGSPSVLILLDDILTSGATLEAASEVVSEVYKGPVRALVICRVL